MKKGFTLIELLAVMAIVLTITVTTIVGFSTLSKTNQEREYQKQKDKFLTAAKIYAHDNPSFNVYVYSEFNTTGMCVSLQTLVDYNLVSPNIIDPRNSKDYDYGSVVIIKNNSGVLSYELKSKPGVTECKEFTNQAIIYDRIIKDNGVIQTVADDSMFTHAAPADKSENGLWKEARVGKTEGDKPTYFFRGSVQNNYVSFAGKMWRIVRINEDGTVKLILGGNSTEDGYIDSGSHVWYPSYDQATEV
ncbi:MAG: type II secretion system protein, partial [Bacilli bacterium]